MDTRANDFNVLGAYLAARDIPSLSKNSLFSLYGITQTDMLILFGGSLPHGCRLAGKAYTNGLCKSLMIVGGEGHTTDHLRNEMKKVYPQIDVGNRMEADIIADYLKLEFGINHNDVIIENQSTNCGENVIFSLQLLKKLNHIPKNAIIMQDSSMQLRMKATFQKEWAEEKTEIINYAAYRVQIINEYGKLKISDTDIWGIWDIERYITLVMGEIPRLTDNPNGYGPKGKNYIAHIDIPADVNRAYDNLAAIYKEKVRPPWFPK